MTVNRGLYVPINTTGNVGTTELEARLAQAGQYEHNAAGIPRSGLLIPNGSSQTTVVTGAANMSYNLAACYPVICTAANDGVYTFSATGTTNLATTAAPATNSRIDLIWVKQNDKSKGDPDNLAVFGVTQGAAATSPVAPALPARAMEVARATILSTTTATNTATITQTFTYAALKGNPVPVRNTADRATITAPVPGQKVARLDLNANGLTLETWTGAAWTPDGRTPKTVIADNSALVGNATGLQAKVVSGEVQLVNLVMTVVAVTDGAGYVGLNFPAGTFPNGVLTTAFNNGDSGAGGRDCILARSGIHAADTSRVVLSAVDSAGNSLNNRTMRLELNVWGW